MTTVTVLPFEPSVLSLSLDRDVARSPSIHLGAIIRDRLITAGIEKRIVSKSTGDDDQHFQKGFLWERMVTEYITTPEWQCIEWDHFASKHLQQAIDDAVFQSKGHIIRPGEQLMDGIYMTPDAINVRLHHVEEWKATTIRHKNFNIESRKPGWLWQGAAYARKFGMTRVIYRIWHLADMPPMCNQLCVEWTPAEIETNWLRLMQHYQDMKVSGRA